MYDEKGKPYMVIRMDWNSVDNSSAFKLIESTAEGQEYYYEYNLQGDVVGLIDIYGDRVAAYTYDPWGKPLTVTDGNGNTISNASHIANVNPLRYRGYYYDVETGLYYLQSRYYDPEIGRFVNADGYVSTGQGILGYNMFAYCGNNPVNRADPTGRFWLVAVVVTVAITFLLSGCQTTTPNSTSTSSSSLANTSLTTSSNPTTSNTTMSSGGKTVHKGNIRICTDGSDGTKVPDDNWYPETAYSHNGESLDAYTIPYVVIPIGDNSARLGDSALLINHDTGMSVMCVVGERGPAKNGWGEVSIVAIWDTGNPNHMTANHASGLSNNYEIILYPGVRYDWGE